MNPNKTKRVINIPFPTTFLARDTTRDEQRGDNAMTVTLGSFHPHPFSQVSEIHLSAARKRRRMLLLISHMPDPLLAVRRVHGISVLDPSASVHAIVPITFGRDYIHEDAIVILVVAAILLTVIVSPSQLILVTHQ